MMNGTFTKKGNSNPRLRKLFVQHKGDEDVSLEGFTESLRRQDVCSLSLCNAPQWFQEIPEGLHVSYLRLRDHRVHGALLHKDALSRVVKEESVGAEAYSLAV